MASRLNLHEELCELLGSRNVYFQPPESVKLKYPGIVYSLSRVEKFNANDKIYRGMNQYQVTMIDTDPDSEVPVSILTHFPMCSFDRAFTSENLNHFVLTLYY